MLEDLCIHIGNRNGLKTLTSNKSRLYYLFSSLIKHVPNINHAEVLFSDNESEDDSCNFFKKLGIGTIVNRPIIRVEPKWLQTTLNNQLNISDAIQQTNKKFFWNIENDSYFFRSEFIQQALDVLSTREDIVIVNLRYWISLDKKDWIGIPKNLSRYDACSKTPSGTTFYELERRDCDVLWIDVTNDISQDFCFDDKYDPMHCVLSDELKVGNIRNTPDGKYQRLLNEHWNTYASHGYIARTDTLRFIIERYQPLSERNMSMMVRKHFKAAKLEMDAFFSFGWNKRVQNVNEKDIEKMILYCENTPCSSMKEIGTFINSSNVTIYNESQSRVSIL
ncbi:TPA: hypothetical protein HA235_01220 [Candidatus Woesearchaeota archaeon]|nr:hypothetical protein [Candidatus Woesearchaeota archaeon]HIH31304.1 hypothetical protein [Candidatus Woesearchaeota archaeon]HIH55405.1 hypothetical protein [Candidatus Woesearchaeota archaeon]HIJ01597.1 hypothetical protein [Candidatus Woesearchaeota archaeon]HIJ14596.1 hypothetical protein [Candidatus Woesearchaeota archaeon]